MTIKSVDSKTLALWLANDEAKLIDVREKSEYDAERIEGSTLLPLGNVSLNSLPEFVGKKLVMQCRSGKRSLTACERLYLEDSSLEVFNLEGGIEGWKASGFAVKK